MRTALVFAEINHDLFQSVIMAKVLRYCFNFKGDGCITTCFIATIKVIKPGR